MTTEERYAKIQELLTQDGRAALADVLMAADEEHDRLEAGGHEKDADLLASKLSVLHQIVGRDFMFSAGYPS